jgi:hypothetical protein
VKDNGDTGIGKSSFIWPNREPLASKASQKKMAKKLVQWKNKLLLIKNIWQTFLRPTNKPFLLRDL